MPSPPARGQLLPPAAAAASLAASPSVTGNRRVRPEGHRILIAQPAEPAPGASACGRSACTAALPARNWNGARRQVVDGTHRPAVPAVSVGEQGCLLPARSRHGASSPAASTPRLTAAPVAAAGCGQCCGRGRGHRRVLLAEQVASLGRPGHQLAVKRQPVGVQLLPEPGGGDSGDRPGPATPASTRRSVKNGRPVRV